MFTGEWRELDQQFFRLIGARRLDEASRKKASRRALFLDPDTGINNRGGARHVSVERLAREASENELVFSFDQSLSRQFKQEEAMATKLSALNELEGAMACITILTLAFSSFQGRRSRSWSFMNILSGLGYLRLACSEAAPKRSIERTPTKLLMNDASQHPDSNRGPTDYNDHATC